MILFGSLLLVAGLTGAIISLADRKTTGWAATRTKFVVTSWGLMGAGIAMILGGIFEIEFPHRYFIP